MGSFPESGDKLVLILIFFVLFCAYLEQKGTLLTLSGKYDEKDAYLSHIKKLILPLDSRIAKLDFVAGPKSTTLNKKLIVMCMKDKNGSYYPVNGLVQVAIHEVAHAFYKGDSASHPDDWKKLYADLLRRAVKMGIYDPRFPIDKEYCTD